MSNPNIVVKSGDIGPIRRVLTVSERESLQRSATVFGFGKTGGEFMPGPMAGPVYMPGLNVKRQRLNEQQKQILKVLEDQSPEPVASGDRDKLKSHADKLKAMFKPYLQTTAELRASSHRDPTYMEALRKAREWQKPQETLGGRTPQDVAEDYRNLMRRLEPENPEIDSLESLRERK